MVAGLLASRFDVFSVLHVAQEAKDMEEEVRGTVPSMTACLSAERMVCLPAAIPKAGSNGARLGVGLSACRAWEFAVAGPRRRTHNPRTTL